MKIDEIRWNSMKIDENRWKNDEIDENRWKEAEAGGGGQEGQQKLYIKTPDQPPHGGVTGSRRRSRSSSSK